MSVYELAKKNYDRGLWAKEMLATLMAKGLLSAEGFQEITGDGAAIEHIQSTINAEHPDAKV